MESRVFLDSFTLAWEQRKLSSLCDKFTDGDWIEAKDQSNSGVRLIQTGNVGIAEYIDKPNNKKWVSNSTFETLHCEEVFEGDILISRLPEPAGRACIVPNLGTKMITAVDCTIVRVSDNTSNEFLLQYLSSQKYFDEVNTCLAGGTRQRISRSNLANFDVPIPTKKKEQEAIGSFFANLDHLITLHQCKCDYLIRLKYRTFSLLNKTAWEQRKLGEVAKYRNGKAHENCIDDNGKYIVVNSKFVSTDGEVRKFSNMQNEALFENEIAFVLSDVPNGRAIARTFLIEKSDKYTLNQRIAGITPLSETYPYYLHILMNRNPYFLAFDDGAKQTNLSVSDVMEFESYYPIYDEQKQIGEYFRNLDHLITLHQRKPFCINRRQK